MEDDDVDRAAILARRAQWLAIALTVGCDPGTSTEPTAGTAPPVPAETTSTAPVATATAAPTPCLSFLCPAGSVHVNHDGTPADGLLTSRPNEHNCVPPSKVREKKK